MGKYFGTDGVRGIANEKLTSSLAYRIGRYIGFNNAKKTKILIARDTRLSGKFLSDALESGIICSGGDVVNIDISTTPSVSYIVRNFDFDYGVMISASHNPYYDNGIKIFNRDGEKLCNEIELEIEKYIDSDEDYLPLAINDKIGRVYDGQKYLDSYIDFLISKANKNVANLKILVDCANGSASFIAPKIIKALNINAKILNNDPNGTNINDMCGSTHISSLKDIVKKGDYDIAFAFDGDADRCLAMDRLGKIIDGDGIMFLNAIAMKEKNELKNDTVVLTVMSNIGLKKAFAKHNINLSEVCVGDKYVQAEMKKYGYSLGGEQSGHIIFLDDMNTGDGILTMIKILNIVAEKQKNVDELLSDLIIYPQELKNITVQNKEAILSHQGFLNLIKTLENELGDNGRILVRPSGTEPLIRVMCEARTKEECSYICSKLIDYISELL